MSRQQLLENKARIRRVISADRAHYDGRLSFAGDGAQIVLDIGERSASGYTVFSVEKFTGNCKLRFAFSDRLCAFDYPVGRERGDCSRGAATYLGVELPVLPADPYRYELYTICRTGTYVHPLVQGQYRFVCVTLLGDGSAELDDFYTVNASVPAREEGDFACSDENLTNLWHIGARTVAIATVRARQVDRAAGKLLLRPLTKGDNRVTVKGIESDEGEAAFAFSLTENPRAESAIAFCLRGAHTATVRICADGTVTCSACGEEKTVRGVRLPYDKIHEGKLAWHGDELTLALGGKTIRFAVVPCAYAFGLQIGENDWAVLHKLTVAADGVAVNGVDTRNLRAFMGKWFISDGAKRDRLPWSGDLEWAGKSAYYCLGRNNKMRHTLSLLLGKQNPDGYYPAVTYPEDKIKPKRGDWGLYQSDIFCCWLTPVMHRYVLFTGDIPFAQKHYEGLKKSLCYLEKQIGADGLFYQRYETSKGLWDNELGDVGENTYANILLSGAFTCFSELAEWLGKSQDKTEYAAKGEKLKGIIEKELFDEASGLYVKSKEDRKPCNMSSPLALALGLCSQERARRIRDNCGKLQIASGKILLLLIEGLYRYGFGDAAFARLTGKNPFTDENGFSSEIDWYTLCKRDDCPHTTSECGLPPRVESDSVECWGDRSHPDTAASYILSGCVLGIRPTAPGFGKFVFAPDLHGLHRAEGSVPTPYGPITAQADRERMVIRYPQNLIWENADAYPDCVIEKQEGGRK